MNYTTSALQPIRLLINHEHQMIKKKPTKPHVSAACANCKKAHLACDVSRPCQRCISTDKADSCHDIQHKKRGRPKMLRDSNNKKIRPNKPSVTNNDYHHQIISFSSDTTASDINSTSMTIILSMDLCCARVTGPSLDYLKLYPQEFSHRSIYEFLLPENKQVIQKAHRCLLDNAVQHQQQKFTPETIRSSFDGFHSASLNSLLSIANGSLTLKQKLTFASEKKEMDCKLYLGGGFGADLFDPTSLKNLYIVCTMTPSVISLSEPSSEQHVPIALTAPLFQFPSTTSTTSTASPTETNESLEEEGYYDDMDDLIINTDELIETSVKEEEEEATTTTTNYLLDKFRQKNTQRINKQFMHPHELYYLNTTSSRLSSEAIAHTAYPYLSAKLTTNFNSSGSSSLAAYNNLHSKHS